MSVKPAKGIREMTIIASARWLTLAEACFYMQRSVNKVKSLIRAGEIYGTKPDGNWVIDRESIDLWFNEERNDRRLELARRGICN